MDQATGFFDVFLNGTGRVSRSSAGDGGHPGAHCADGLCRPAAGHSELRKIEGSSFGDVLMAIWIGLRENLQETIDFPTKYGVFL